MQSLLGYLGCVLLCVLAMRFIAYPAVIWLDKKLTPPT